MPFHIDCAFAAYWSVVGVIDMAIMGKNGLLTCTDKRWENALN
jgi:hypothetical protein